MDFPIFLVIILAAVVLLIVTLAVYVRLYKRNMGKTLDNSAGTHASIIPLNKAAIVLTIVFLIIVISISYFTGYKVAYDTYEENLSQTSTFDIQTYFAEVKEISGNALLVEGISINDEDYRGEFRYDVLEETKLEWHDNPISLSDIDEGDLVSITLVVDQTGVEDIFKIQLLDDEK